MSNKPQSKKVVAEFVSDVHVLGCPFCGDRPALYPVDPSKEGDAFGQVRCENDACPAQPCVNDGEDCADTRGSTKYIKAAVDLWNRRK